MFPTVISNQLQTPVFIMGVVATTAGAFAAFFPETLGEKRPETMDEALRFFCIKLYEVLYLPMYFSQ